jgi:hypothetical protein
MEGDTLREQSLDNRSSFVVERRAGINRSSSLHLSRRKGRKNEWDAALNSNCYRQGDDDDLQISMLFQLVHSLYALYHAHACCRTYLVIDLVVPYPFENAKNVIQTECFQYTS